MKACLSGNLNFILQAIGSIGFHPVSKQGNCMMNLFFEKITLVTVTGQRTRGEILGQGEKLGQCDEGGQQQRTS